MHTYIHKYINNITLRYVTLQYVTLRYIYTYIHNKEIKAITWIVLYNDGKEMQIHTGENRWRGGKSRGYIHIYRCVCTHISGRYNGWFCTQTLLKISWFSRIINNYQLVFHLLITITITIINQQIQAIFIINSHWWIKCIIEAEARGWDQGTRQIYIPSGNGLIVG